MPPYERAKAVADAKGVAFDIRGMSVTELEIAFGVLAHDGPVRSFFYFREGQDYAAMGAAAPTFSDRARGDATSAERQDALKARIRTEHAARCRTYRPAWNAAKQRLEGLEELCRQVEADIWAELDAETAAFAAAPAPTWEDQERSAIADLVEHRARGFVGRQEVIAELLAHARSPAFDILAQWADRLPGDDRPLLPEEQRGRWGMVVAGAAGSGKSALFAKLYQELSADQSLFLLAHSFGSTPRGGAVDAVQRRWIQECFDHLGRKPDLPEHPSSDDLDEALRAGLSQVSVQRRVVVLLDAPDQADASNRGRFITWLPRIWPDNARLIVTGIPGEGVQHLMSTRRSLRRLDLPALGVVDAEAIADGCPCRSTQGCPWRGPPPSALAASRSGS